MKVAIAAGAEIDLATPAEIKKMLYQKDAYQRSILKKLRASDVMPTAGVLVLRLGQPPAGKVWDLRQIWISGNDPTATVANLKTAVGIGMPPQTAALLTSGTVDAAGYYDTASSFPHTNTWSRFEATIQTQEWLFVVCSAAAATTQINVSAQVVESSTEKSELDEEM